MSSTRRWIAENHAWCWREGCALLFQQLSRSVDLHPTRLLLRTATRCLTYPQADAAANRVANELFARRGDVSEPIALLVADPVLMMLGVLKAGKLVLCADQSALPRTANRSDARGRQSSTRVLGRRRTRTHCHDVYRAGPASCRTSAGSAQRRGQARSSILAVCVCPVYFGLDRSLQGDRAGSS